MYDSIVDGLNEAVEYEKGNSKKTRTRVIHIPALPNYRGSEIKAIRIRYQLTQKLFAELLGVSPKTIEAWEAGKNIPQGPAQRFLSVLDQDGETQNAYIQNNNRKNHSSML